eukprot:m.50070 g.50070  ORF g.50070 m.50070 type:complete len:395 (-) comp6516_c0_seq1:46-1230(-)
MNRWTHSALSAMQRPVMAESEREVLVEPGLRLYDGDDRTEFEDGLLTLSTHRLVWVENTARSPKALQLPLQYISRARFVPGWFFHSPKIVLDLLPPAPDIAATAVRPNSPHAFVKLSFRKSDGDLPERFLAAIDEAIEARAWAPKKDKGPTEEMSSYRMYGPGILGLQRKQQHDLQNADSAIEDAFRGDIDALMVRAKEMVALSQKYAAKMAKQSAVSDSEQAQLDEYMKDMGIENPVTRQTFKSNDVYIRELARQLAEFLVEPLRKAKGMMALSDIYCIFNRARGTALVSPDDLVVACRQFEFLGLPLRLRTFASGVLVVQSQAQSDEATAKAIRQMLETEPFVTASRLANDQDISLTLAGQHLATAELAGVVCRDDTVQGLRFYPNRFLTPT